MKNRKNFKKIITGGLLAIILTIGMNTTIVKASESVDPPVVFQRMYRMEKTSKLSRLESVDPPVVFERP